MSVFREHLSEPFSTQEVGSSSSGKWNYRERRWWWRWLTCVNNSVIWRIPAVPTKIRPRSTCVECNQAPIQLYTHGELFLFRYRATLDSILLSSGEELVDALKTFIEASTLFLSRWHFTLADTKETSSGIYKIFQNIAGFNTPQTGYKRIAEPSESPASQILAICQQIVGKFDQKFQQISINYVHIKFVSCRQICRCESTLLTKLSKVESYYQFLSSCSTLYMVFINNFSSVCFYSLLFIEC